MSAGKTATLYQAPGYQGRLCGAVKDGTIGFTADGAAMLRRGPMSPEDARKLAGDLSVAAHHASELIAQAKGEHLWGSVAIDGDVIVMQHRGSKARMRPVVNGRRRCGSLWRCTACNREVATGARMYVCEGPAPFRWGTPRICAPCTKPADPIDRLALLVSFDGLEVKP